MTATQATHSTSNSTSRRSSRPEAHPRAGSEAKHDIYATVTEQIIDAIEQGVRQDGRPLWRGQGRAQALPHNFKTGARYRGINVLTLWIAANVRGYGGGAWLTYRQAEALGWHVRKGEKAVPVVFYQTTERQSIDPETGEEETRNGIILRTYSLFNLDQLDIDPPLPAVTAFQGIEVAEAIMGGSGARIIEAGAKAYYRPQADEIHLPARDRFDNAEDFYAVALHELTHWTGHASRLARSFEGRFGDETYAFEELIAEIGAAFVCADIGIAPATMDGHARYIDGWLTVLRRDKRAIFTAASAAAKAHAFLMAAGAS